MNDVKQEWNDFMHQAYEYPEGLSGVEERLKERILRSRTKRKAVFGSLSAVAAMLLFVILVNTSTAFAGCVADLPVIGDLAEFVKFDKSLTNAIKNDYVQQVDQIAWDGENQLFLPYVIADEKHLVLFFRLPEDFKLKPNQSALISLQEMKNGATGAEIEESYSSSAISAEDMESNTGFIQQSYLFTKGDLPKSIEMKVSLETDESRYPEGVQEEDGWEVEPESITKTVGTFVFRIHLNDFAKPRNYTFHQELSVMNQRMTLEDVKVYPAGTEVSFTFPDENSAWIKSLNLAIEQNGKITAEGIKNGISACVDDKKMNVYIESNYFEKPSPQQLLIRGAQLLEKTQEYVTVDLNDRTITPTISGMSLKEIKRGKNGKAQLTFATKLNDDMGFGLFARDYRDTAGNTYSYRSESSTVNNSVMETWFTVECPPDGKLIFQRSSTPTQYLKDPVRIELPQ